MKRLVFFMFIFALASGCSDYGDKVTLPNLDVFYKSGVTRDEAQKLGDWLVKEGFTQDGTNKSVQLIRNGNTIVFRMVVKKGLESDEKVIEMMREFCGSISNGVFDGQKVEINLCDDHFETLRTVIQV